MKRLFEIIWFRHFLIAVSIIGLSQIGAYLFRCKAYNTGQQMLAPLSAGSDIEQNGFVKFSTLEKNDLQKLVALSNILQYRKNHHKTVFLKLYQYHFASVSILLILSAISVVVIFIVAQDGLKNTNQYIKTVFFTLAALTTFYALSPVVYKQDATISRNLGNYLYLDNLQSEIYNYAVTKPNATSSLDTLSFFEFHSKIIKSMTDKNTIDLEFDYKSINTPEFFKTD